MTTPPPAAGKYIHRFPNPAGLMRGPNMAREFCQICSNNQTHGFKIVDQTLGQFISLFVCDDCLEQARKQAK